MTPQIQSGGGARIHSGVGAQKRSGVGARLLKIHRMQSGVGVRMQEDTAAREQLQTRGGRKNNKALIKVDNLKGSSDTRRVNSPNAFRRSSRSKMRRFVELVFKTDDRK